MSRFSIFCAALLMTAIPTIARAQNFVPEPRINRTDPQDINDFQGLVHQYNNSTADREAARLLNENRKDNDDRLIVPPNNQPFRFDTNGQTSGVSANRNMPSIVVQDKGSINPYFYDDLMPVGEDLNRGRYNPPSSQTTAYQPYLFTSVTTAPEQPYVPVQTWLNNGPQNQYYQQQQAYNEPGDMRALLAQRQAAAARSRQVTNMDLSRDPIRSMMKKRGIGPYAGR